MKNKRPTNQNFCKKFGLEGINYIAETLGHPNNNANGGIEKENKSQNGSNHLSFLTHYFLFHIPNH